MFLIRPAWLLALALLVTPAAVADAHDDDTVRYRLEVESPTAMLRAP